MIRPLEERLADCRERAYARHFGPSFARTMVALEEATLRDPEYMAYVERLCYPEEAHDPPHKR